MEWVAIIISLCSLCISGAIYWKEYKTPFKPRYAFGFINIYAPPTESNMFRVVLNLTITNSGATDGIIKDMIIKLKDKKTKNEWFLTPQCFIDIEKFYQLQPPRREVDFVKDTFSPIYLAKKESRTEAIMFRNCTYDNKKHPLLPIKEGKYEMLILAAKEMEQYDVVIKSEINIEKDTMEKIHAEQIIALLGNDLFNLRKTYQLDQ